jgi:hypothetical protein
MIDTRELRNRQTLLKISNKEIAKKMNISVSTFVNLKMNRYKWKDHYKIKLCEIIIGYMIGIKPIIGYVLFII